MNVRNNVTKHGCGRLDVVQITWIGLKKCRFAIRAPLFVVDYILKTLLSGMQRQGFARIPYWLSKAHHNQITLTLNGH
ncbi:hypothetical protein TNCV_2366501 [Trichonephila clavipes]|nr:hypothetical protein TNCV_2366501 [Trichonephila clavipes]